jgi:hypothetical protein
VVGDSVPMHDAVEVRLQLGLLGEVLRPVVGRLEAVAVEMIPDVDARARIGVLPPGSAHSGVLLDDGVGNARLLHPDRGEEAGLAASDDDDGKLGPGLGAGFERGDP